MEFRELLKEIAKESLYMGHNNIDIEHLLLTLTKTGGLESKALLSSGADYTLMKEYLSRIRPAESRSKEPKMSEKLKQLIEDATKQVKRAKGKITFEESLLLNILTTDSTAKKMLSATNVDTQQVYNVLDYYISTKSVDENDKEYPNLKKYGENLNIKSLNKIDGVIGREKEIERIIQIVTRRTKNNPVLIGEAGVGKTAIVEGLAKKIAMGDVPDIMKDKKIISLDMSAMVAGTKYRGDFEKRIVDTLKEVKSMDDVILFIDEIHTIVGAGGSEGGLDASNIMKPYLTKGDLKIIGATTITEYRQFIEKEAALERRMQPIYIEEPSVEETIEMIKGIKNNYEKYHRIQISDEVIEEAVRLSDRYLIDRFLPDKAIDVIDEAGSKLKVNLFKFSEEEISLVDNLKKLKEQKEISVNKQNFEEAAYIRDEIKESEEKLFDIRERESKNFKFSGVISIENIREIISDWSKVPVTQLTKAENEKYRDLDKNLKDIIIGQNQAVDSVSKAIKRARVGLKEEHKPIGTFIFVGPTGVGKTYLAKLIAEELFGSQDDLIRIDMSEYMEKHTVSKLIGSPPGYVGYEEGGQLTEKVRSKPYSVILFDEIEKAHPDVFNILLQILDEGRLTDSQGTTVDFKNTIIIMTSNAGASKLSKKRSIGFTELDSAKDYENIKEVVNEELKNLFKPEFLNRIDDIIVFNRLEKEDIKEIVRIKLDELVDRIKELGYFAKYSDKVVEYIANKGFDDNYGVRPLDRAIKTEIEDLVANEILENNLKNNDVISFGFRNEKIQFNIKPKCKK